MIGLDANVLVRLLTADDAAQLKTAKRLLVAHEGETGAFFVNDMVLVELVWVLRRLYGHDAGAALSAVASLLAADAFAFEDRDRVQQALALCSASSHDFADVMIVLKNTAAGCAHTASFDRALRNLTGARLP